ncbi:hypothetical protein BRD12_05315, partial [Halobacteriales archaeon SW_12_67_38]
GAAFAVAPVEIALLVPWLAGATFGLNPFGDEGAVLPATLTGAISGGAFVRGLALVGPGVLAAVALVVPALLRGFLAALGSGVVPFVLRWLGERGVPLMAAPAGWFEGVGPAIRGLATIEVRAVGYALPILVLLVGGFIAYRAAARRFDAYEIT